MATIDFATLDWYSLIRRMRWSSDAELIMLDEIAASKLNTMEQVERLYDSSSLDHCPKTIAKLNEVLLEYLNAPIIKDYAYPLVSLANHCNDAVKYRITELFAEGRTNLGSSIGKFIVPNCPYNLGLMHRSIERYLNGRHYWRGCTGKAFICLRAEDLEEGCRLLSKSTPNIQALLLERQDISEEYILIGLKALGKLKDTKQVRVKIKTELLKRLSPKGRLDVIKHLIGYNTRYYWRYHNKLPAEFEVPPTKEELGELLFSCSMKYYNQVSAVLQYYNTYLERLKFVKEKT